MIRTSTLSTRYGTPLMGTTDVGSRFATRVRVISDSAFRGQRGVIVRIHHAGSIVVRLGSVEMPFGLGELVASHDE